MITDDDLMRLREALRVPVREPVLRTSQRAEADLAPLRAILRVVGRFYCVAPMALIARPRDAHLSAARHLAMYLARRMTLRSFPAIARFFRRDHSTVIYACKRIEARCAASAVFAGAVEEVAKHAIAEIREEERAADEANCIEHGAARCARDAAA
jgi:chromosomal replication initiation ATPase DnaA